MNRKISLLVGLTVFVVVTASCRNRERTAPSVDVPTPQMPADWQVGENVMASAEDLSGMATRMNAQLLRGRNTTYTVGDQRVQLNTIIAASPADAESVMRFLLAIKTEEALLRRGTTIYEFVGPDAVMPHIRTGRQHLEARP